MKRSQELRKAISRRDLAAALKLLPQMTPAERAAMLLQHNEHVLALVGATEDGTLRAKIGDLTTCYLGDGADGVNVFRDHGLVDHLLDGYRVQLLLDSENETLH